MTNAMNKRKWAGEPHREAKQREPDPLKLPPHKKPKVWRLTVQWTETVTRQMTHAFPSKAARDESRARVERHFREEAVRQKQTRRRYWYGGWYNSPLSSYHESERKEIKVGPEYIETYEDKQPESENDARS